MMSAAFRWPRRSREKAVRPPRDLARVHSAWEALRELRDSALAQRGAELAAGWDAGPGELAALAAEAIRRVHGLAARDNQMLAALALLSGGVAEMATGEGKTLSALVAAICFGFERRGVHVATVNSYLAARDWEFAAPVAALLGLDAGLLRPDAGGAEKRAAYACAITYGVGTEFGFDYLRDQLQLRAHGRQRPLFHEILLGTAPAVPHLLQRGHACAIIDEADSVLIDEANAPLIITASQRTPHPHPEPYLLACDLARQMVPGMHYQWEPAAHRVTLTESGRAFGYERLSEAVQHQLERLWPAYLEAAARARHGLRRDVHYVVLDGKVVIVDEFTGRLCPERSWRDGLHQAVEAAAGVAITSENRSEAAISRPSYFQLYDRLCGLTGTAREAASELSRTYRLQTRLIPPHRPCRRLVLPDRLFATREAKMAAAAQEAAARSAKGQPVLVGSRTIEASEQMAAQLEHIVVRFTLLNGKQDADEAPIIGEAGKPGRITIATNMAGRGAHIPLDPSSIAAGGLHVLGLERHESARIDRQLIGRAARQGEPGSAQFFLSLEDALLERHVPEIARELAARHPGAIELPPRTSQVFPRIQAKIEARHRHQRADLARQAKWINELKSVL
jgi:preprotein translocase subunit SecA